MLRNGLPHIRWGQEDTVPPGQQGMPVLHQLCAEEAASVTTRGYLVLDMVKNEVQKRYPGILIRAWVDSPGVICIVYREIHTEFEPLILGLRRTLEPYVPVDSLVDEIVNREIGEPLGSLQNELLEDADGVWWFEGNRPEWRLY